jgi:two-component system, OmpR family, phosphate regulon sensor histidine kinase PhoR
LIRTVGLKLKTDKNLIMATALLLGLLIVSFICWTFADLRHSDHLLVGTRNVLIAIGIVWLGWYCLNLIRALYCSIGLIRHGRIADIKSDDNTIIRQLGQAVHDRLANYCNYITELEKQVNDLQIKVQLLKGQKQNTEAIIYSIRDAVIVVDEFDRLLMANEVAGKLFNFDFKRSQRKPMADLIDSSCFVLQNDISKFLDFLKQSRQSKTPAAKKELVLKTSESGEQKTYDCVISCICDENKEICGTVAVLQDVTGRKKISRIKDDFVSQVSHELKTPLAAIIAYSEMLADGEAADEKTKSEFCTVIQNHAQRLNRLIEDLLNTARIESGLMKIDKQLVSLPVLIDEQIKMIKSYAQERDIRIIEPNNKNVIVFGQVYANKDMLSQVVINLLSNAIKYTNAGGSIKIDTEVDDAASIATVSVTDTGIGIEPDQLEHVFDKFFRTQSGKNHAEGSGLGLNLVKKIVEGVHGGRVFVKSTPGTGSTFGFELPLATHELLETF